MADVKRRVDMMDNKDQLNGLLDEDQTQLGVMISDEPEVSNI